MAAKKDKSTGTEVTVFGSKNVAVALKGMSVKRRITVPLKLLQPGDEFYFKPEGEVVKGEASSTRKGFDKAMDVMPVIDLQTGEALTLIVQMVLGSALSRVPGGYVGKDFLAVVGPKMPGKNYFQIELFELEGKAPKQED